MLRRTLVWFAAGGCLVLGAERTQGMPDPQIRASLLPAQQEVLGWGLAVKAWVADSPKSLDAQLARGVLLECLASPAHGTGYPKSMLSAEDDEACGYHAPQSAPPGHDLISRTWLELPMSTLGCEKGARTVYEKILKTDPSREEAELRLGYLRVREPRLTPAKDDEPGLVRLAAAGSDARTRYLASLFLGLAAEKRRDLDTAARRYEAARAVGPDWPSARFALASVQLQQARPDTARDLLAGDAHADPADPWNGYSCRIMTPGVADELRAWERKVASVR
jgi:hypothetical protein